MSEESDKYWERQGFVNSFSFMFHSDATEQGIEVLKNFRRIHATANQELSAIRKSLGRPATEEEQLWFKWFKEEIKRFQRLEQAATIWIDFFLERKLYRDIGEFPRELEPELRLAAGAYFLWM